MKRISLQLCVNTARRGSLLIETIVAAIILGTAISMLVPAMTAVRRQRQSLRFESLAMVELNNITEFLPSSEDSASRPALSGWFQSRYGKAKLETEILPSSTDDDAAAALQAVRLTIHQPSFQSMPEQKVSIVVWQRVQEQAP